MRAMEYNRPTKKMKKLLVMAMVIFAFALQSKAADYAYIVKVSITVNYEFYDGFNLVSEQSGPMEFQTIEVCASSPQEARDKAIEQCDRMCRGKQKMGTTYVNGKEVDKYKLRTVYDAQVTSTGPLC